MDVRLSKPKKVQLDQGGRTFKNSDFRLQDDLQRSFYRSKECMSPLMKTTNAFEENHVSYTNLKKIKNTIDIWGATELDTRQTIQFQENKRF